MKLTRRAVLAALITPAVAAAALLSSSPPALATPVPPAPDPALFGTWVNLNPNTTGIKEIEITPAVFGITIDVFPANTRDWGGIRGTVFGSTASSPTGGYFEGNWDFGFKRAVLWGGLIASPVGPGQALIAEDLNTFTDNSGRANYQVTDVFTRAANPAGPGRFGTAATGYPVGNSPSPVPSLPGTWVNISPTGAMREIILTAGPGGTLTVSAFGNCGPPLCPWGTVTGTTFGASISSTTGAAFLASYTFGFANKLVIGYVNVPGDRLVVYTLTEFTDHSGRSNYLSGGTFTRG